MASEYTLPAEVLSDIAGAIRSKAGLTGPIKPVDMAAAINSIPSGGGFGPEDEGKVVSGGVLVAQTALTVTANATYDTTTNNSVTVNVPHEAPDKDINFYDLDGVRLFSYSREEFAALTELPTAPNRPELFLNFTQWNWTTAEINAQPGYVEVAALYDLTDCDAAIIVEPTLAAQFNATLRFYCGTGNTISLDWGDGSAVETYTQSGSNQTVATHTWPELYKRYRIRLTRTAGSSLLYLGGAANANLLYGTNGDGVSIEPVREVYIGSNCETRTVLAATALLDKCIYCTSAKKQTGQIYLRSTSFALNRNSNFEFSALANWGNILCKTIAAGNSLLPFKSSTGMRYNRSEKMTIPQGVTVIGSNALSDAPRLKSLHIPSSVTSLASSAIANNYPAFGAIPEVWFYGTPPTATASNSFGLLAYTTIFVPFASIAAYLTGTNYPAATAVSYIGFATYANGAALPSTDTTSAYNITWYASKADAAAETNPITQGNGAQIYCKAVAI